MATLKLNETIFETTIGKRSGEGKTFQVNVADLPTVSVERLLAYGVQRYINDKLGGSDMTLEAKIEGAESIIQALKDGNVGRTVGVSVDDETKEARKIARAHIRRALGANYKKFSGLDPKEQTEKLDQFIEKNDESLGIRKEAERRIAEAKAASEKIDVSDLF